MRILLISLRILCVFYTHFSNILCAFVRHVDLAALPACII